MVQAEKDMYVSNILVQRGIKAGSNGLTIRYEVIEKCL